MAEEQQKLLQQMYVEQKLVDSNLSMLQQHIERLQVILANYRSGLAVLKELKGKEAGEEMLMNVGGSIFVQAKLVDPNAVTRGIGSGVRIEQSLDEATSSVENSVEKLETQLNEASQQYQKLSVYMQQLTSTMQNLVEQIQQPQLGGQ